MSDGQIIDEENKRREKLEKKQREAYKRNFGIYPEQTWKF